MKHRIFLLIAVIALIQTSKLYSQVLINGPTTAATNDIVNYEADLTYNPCQYGYIDLYWDVTGGTILSQNVNPGSGTVFCQVQWTATPGNPAFIKLYGAPAPAPPGFPEYCFNNGPELLQTLNVTIGIVTISPVSQYVSYYGANATPICVSMTGVTINSYQWRVSSSPSGTWSNTGTNASCLQVNTVVAAKYYTCVLQTSAGTFTSPAAFISYLELRPGSISTTTLVPSLNQSLTISQSPATGGHCSGIYQYEWEVSIENGPWVVGGTNANYPSTINILGNTRIRRKVSCTGTFGDVQTLYTNTLIINPVYTPGDYENRNYVREITVQKKGIVSWYHADAQVIGDKLQSTTYLDGFGKAIQGVDKGVSSSSGGTWKDIVHHYEYDEAGRVLKNYLPYATTDNPGKFKTNAVTAQPAYISSFFGEPANEPTYSLIQPDNSPLNRVLKSMNPGASWAGDDIGISESFDFNNANEKVHIWTLAYSSSALPVTSPTSVYSAGTLSKNVVTDEKGNKIITYTDLSGHLILKKVQEESAGLLGVEHDTWVCTYNVYDDLGHLRYIISPKAVEYLDNNSWNLTQTLVDELCFKYLYDKKGRIICKKQPGTGEEKIIYDKKDRAVLMQHANQDKVNNTLLTKNQWIFVLYDDLDRSVATGLLDNDGDQATLQGYVSQLTNAVVTISAFVGAGNESIKADNPVAGSSGSSNYLTGTSNIIFNSITYYDNYSYTGVKSFNNTYTLAYTSTPNIEPTVKTDRTTGMVTGERTRVLTSTNNKFLFSTQYYDEEGRVLESLVDNSKMYNSTGSDYQVRQYDFAGKLMSSYTSHKPDVSTSHTIIAKNEYDITGRLTKLSKNFNNSFYKQLAEYTYDELGYLKTRRLAPGYTGGGGNEIELLTYDYNILGLLTGINKDYALSDNNYTQWDKYFSMYIGYDNRDNKFSDKQLNGNIAGLIWRSQGDNTPRKFDFTYDRLDRFTSALFKQRKKPSETTWSNAEIDFSTYIEYEDGNGNLKSMKHMGVIPGVNNGVTIDDLRYSYLPTGISGLNGNKLKQVDDLGSLGSNNGLLGDFKDPNTVQDYYYDVNGNLVKDLNKGIGNGSANGITYNYMNKPEKIVVDGKSTIEFTYEASGGKLEKKVEYTDGSVRITTYIGDYVYEQFVLPGGGGAGELLQYVLHEEGRLKIITPHAKANDIDYDLNAGSFGITSWSGGKHAVFEYFIKDHLGSTRMVLTEEVQKEYYKATMEFAKKDDEEPLFGQVDTNVPPTPTAANELKKTRLQYSAPGEWPTNTTDVVKLTASSSDKVLGPNMVLKVMAGDIINTYVDYYFSTNISTGSGNLLPTIGTSFINALVGAQSTTLGKNQSTLISSNLTGSSDFTAFLNEHSNPGNAPKAHLNIIFVDEQFKFIEGDPVASSIGSRSKRVSEADENNTGANMSLNQKAPKNGWVFIFLSNESNQPVYFDNLQIRHDHSRIAEENHYYPFGQKIAGICSKAVNKLENKNNFQGNYSVEEEETGWNEFSLRMYDPQIGRWTGVDPYHIYGSPYTGMENNPINSVDPDGGDPTDYIRLGDIVFWDEAVDGIGDFIEMYGFGKGYEYIGKNLSKEILDLENLGIVSVFYGYPFGRGPIDVPLLEKVTVSASIRKSSSGGGGVGISLDIFKAGKYEYGENDGFWAQGWTWTRNVFIGAYNGVVDGAEFSINPSILTAYDQFQTIKQDVQNSPPLSFSGALQSFKQMVTDPHFTEDIGSGIILGGGLRMPGGRSFTTTAATTALKGRLGNAATRNQIGNIAAELKSRGYQITGGGGVLAEEYLKPLGKGRKGGSYPDITATKGGRTIRINTVDTYVNGKPTIRELTNAARIRTQTPGDHLLLIPKPK